MIETLGIIASVTLPLWNIPLILRIERRKSSADMSLWWIFGVWGSFLLMLPAGLQSADRVFKVFSIINIIFLTLVVIQVMRYR